MQKWWRNWVGASWWSPRNWFPRKFSTGLGTSTTFGGVVEVEVILIGEGVVEVGERCGKGEI